MLIRTSAHFSRSSEVQIGGRSVCRHGHVEWCSLPNHLNSVPHLESVTTDSRASCSICGWVSASGCHTPRVSNFLVLHSSVPWDCPGLRTQRDWPSAPCLSTRSRLPTAEQSLSVVVCLLQAGFPRDGTEQTMCKDCAVCHHAKNSFPHSQCSEVPSCGLWGSSHRPASNDVVTKCPCEVAESVFGRTQNNVRRRAVKQRAGSSLELCATSQS